MQPGARAAAAIAVLEVMAETKRPAKLCLQDWGRSARYAGAKDRAAVSGLVLDALRHKSELTYALQSDTPRALVLGVLGRIWRKPVDKINADFTASEHAPDTLLDEEIAGLGRDIDEASEEILSNMPVWIWPLFQRAFRQNALQEAQAQCTRAPVDLRLNTLVKPAAQSVSQLLKINAKQLKINNNTARIEAPNGELRSPHVLSLPGFSKGWFEVQDAGSQLVTLCTGSGPGAQVLDYCAGGGGKTLALAQQMQNKGQVFAYDVDGRRLAPIYDRLKRAGVRNVQVRDPGLESPLDDLTGKMDVVLIDAPCTGTGTWRRHPDAKWRLRQGQLDQRIGEQDQVLRKAALFVRPGGMMFYVTCSLLCEENEDRVDAFLAKNDGFGRVSVAETANSGGHLNEDAQILLHDCLTSAGDLRLSPHTTKTDGFYMAALQRKEH